jgi:general nucleoside transport system permease protein
VKIRLLRGAMGLVAPFLALAISFAIISLILIAAGDPVGAVWDQILDWPARRNLSNIIDKTTVFYLSGIAVAIGFRMNLFNIGVEGQFLVAALVAAIIGGEAWLSGYLNTGLAILAGMLAGAAYAGIAGVLRAYRGVSEVISTIMLNSVAVGLTAFLLREFAGPQPAGSYIITTKTLPESSWIPNISIGEGSATEIYGFVYIAAFAGLAYWFLINKTRFGFDLRATGGSMTAAVASGINTKRMTVAAMLLSGGFAGLVGLPYIFGEYHSYGSTFPAGLGFTGIAVALIGRNHPFGVALGAFLFAFLDEQTNALQIVAGVSPEIVKIMQGVILLTVVIAYEVVRRFGVRIEQQVVSRELERARDAGATPPPTEEEEATR